MIPSFEQVMELSRECNVIPISNTFFPETESSIQLFQCFDNDRYACMMEYVEDGGLGKRYSCVGIDPFLIVRASGGSCFIIEDGRQRKLDQEPMEVLEQLLDQYRSPVLPDILPFTSSAVGLFGSDSIRHFESLSNSEGSHVQLSDFHCMFCNQWIVLDHEKQMLQVLVNIRIPEQVTEAMLLELYDNACNQLALLERRMLSPSLPDSEAVRKTSNQVTAFERNEGKSMETKESFKDRFDQAQVLIRDGKVDQMMLSQRYLRTVAVEPLDVYHVLRMSNPTTFMYVLKMDDETLVGVSSEALLRVHEDSMAIQPLSGAHSIKQITGAIGYLGFNGSMEAYNTANAIIFKEDKGYVHIDTIIDRNATLEAKYSEMANEAKQVFENIVVAEQLFATPIMKGNRSSQHPSITVFARRVLPEPNWDYFIQLETIEVTRDGKENI